MNLRSLFIPALIAATYCFFPASAQAQVGVTTEDEIALQRIFIEANQQQILGNFEKAVKGYQQVLDKDPGNAAAYYELARIYEATDEQDKAFTAITQAIALNPRNKWYKITKADICELAGKPLQAAEIYADLEKNYPGNEFYLTKQAFYLVLGKEPAKALQVYDQLEKRIGINEDITRRKFSIHVGMGNDKKAISELEELIDHYPTETEYRHTLAEFLRQTGKEEQAQEVYRKILELDPQDGEARLAIQQPLAGSPSGNNLQQLEGLFRNPNALLDTKVKALLPLVQQIADQGATGQAQALLPLAELLESQHPDEAKVFALKGDLLYYSEKKMEAAGAYRKALALNKTVFPVWEQMMFALFETQQFRELSKVSEQVLDYFPNQPLAYYMSGAASCELYRYQEALPVLLQGQLMASGQPWVEAGILNRLAEISFRKGNPEEAFRHFEQALQVHPESLVAKTNFAYHLALEGTDIPRARTLLESIPAGQAGNPQVLEAKAALALYQKDYASAGSLLQKAIGLEPGDRPRLLELYGDVLYLQDRTDEAVEYWEKARTAGASSPSLDKKLKDKALH